MTDTLSTETAVEGITGLPVDPRELVPNELNPRRDLGDLTDLTASVRELGVLQNIVVVPRPRSDGSLGVEYVIVMGHRRAAAAVAAGLDKVPVIVRPEMTVAEQLMVMVVENTQRADLTPVEECLSFLRLVDEGVEQKEIAKRCGRSTGHVSKRLAIIKQLPDFVIALLDAGDLTIEAAYKLSQIADDVDLVKKLTSGKSLDDKMIIADVDRQLELRAKAKKRQRVAEDLVKQGHRVISRGQLENFTAAVLCGQDVVKWAAGYDTQDPYSVNWIALDVKAHAGESCHAAAVTDAGAVVWCCDEPSSHTPGALLRVWKSEGNQPTIDEILRAAGLRSDLEPDDDDADDLDESDPLAAAARAERAERAEAQRAEAEAQMEARREVYEAASARAAERRQWLSDDGVASVERDPWPLHAFAATQALYDVFDLATDDVSIADFLGLDYASVGGGFSVTCDFWAKQMAESTIRVAAAAALVTLDALVWKFRPGHTAGSFIPAAPFGSNRAGTSWLIRAGTSWLIDGFLQWLSRNGFTVGDIEMAELDAVLEAEAPEVDVDEDQD